MTRNELLGALCFPEYNFLRENEHLGKHMMFVTSVAVTLMEQMLRVQILTSVVWH